MTKPINHDTEYLGLVLAELSTLKQARIRAGLACEDDHHDMMALEHAASIRRVCESNPPMRIDALMQALTS